MNGTLAHRRQAALHAGRRHPRGRRDRRPQPDAHAGAGARPGRGRLPHRRHQGRRRGPLRRDRHRGHAGRRRPLEGYQEPKPMVFCGLFPVDGDEFATCARRSRSCGSTTLVHLRARDVGRPRLRVPLRLPRPAAHGDRARAPRARVRPQPHRHRPVGGVPRAHGHRRGARDLDNPSEMPEPPQIEFIEEPYPHGHDPHADRLHGHAHGAVPAAAGRDAEDGVPVARAARARVPDPARRGRHRLLRPDEEPHPGLRQPRLRARRLRARRTW